MKIELSHVAQRSLDRMDAAQRRRILDALRRLAADPRDPALDIAPLHGQPGALRLRVGAGASSIGSMRPPTSPRSR